MLRRHRREHVPPQTRELQTARLAQALRPLDHVPGAAVRPAAAGPVMTVRIMRVSVAVTLPVTLPFALAVFLLRVTAHPDLPGIGDRDRRILAARPGTRHGPIELDPCYSVSAPPR
ncbi:hypothetical protein MPPM_1084 [Methylorubrum populi]|uniref:Uncharacterized protein n=1 Tax=Methylorubrum populi TaxID=223967 RepID=A0A160PAC0_9HYPH|nr:hypothetical protein MPPM_1084 [Methylorubrum populi]